MSDLASAKGQRGSNLENWQRAMNKCKKGHRSDLELDEWVVQHYHKKKICRRLAEHQRDDSFVDRVDCRKVGERRLDWLFSMFLVS